MCLKHFNIRIALVLAITLGLTAGNVLAVEVSEEDYKGLQACKEKLAEKPSWRLNRSRGSQR